MPFHFCSDELFMLMQAIPFLGAFAWWVHGLWQRVRGKKHKCHHEELVAKEALHVAAEESTR